MKKLLVVLFLLLSCVSFSQEKKRTLDEEINIKLDSLSKVYNKKVVAFGYVSYRGVKKTHIRYVENGKAVTKIIKTEIIDPSNNEDD